MKAYIGCGTHVPQCFTSKKLIREIDEVAIRADVFG